MMDWNLNTNRCTGCCACSDVCPVGAITMGVDASGSRCPQLNNSLCVSCNKCKRVCPQFYSAINEKCDKFSYIGLCDDNVLYQKSSSGGIFAAVAESFINRGGVVYGAAMSQFNKRIECRHLRITESEDLHLIQGSKYVQSKMDGVYKKIKQDLKEGKDVLFSGTSCQVAALKNIIGEHEHLFTIDLVCHGVPKDAIYYDYLSFIEKKYKARIEDLSFRVKGYRGFWSDSSYVLKFLLRRKKSNRIVFIPKDKSAYFKLFLQRAGYRQSCYSCQYSSIHKPSDMTLGDYRPTTNEYHEYNLQTAFTYSSIIVHSNRGKSLLDFANSIICLIPIPIEKMVDHHINLQRPSSITNEGKKLMSIYCKKGIEGVQRDIDKFYFINQLKLAIKNKLKNIKALL